MKAWRSSLPCRPQGRVGLHAPISQKLNAESERIRRDYPMHHGEAGRSREEEVREFFALHLPSAFEVKEGFVIDSKGGISKQSDLLLIDALWNKPIGSGPNPFWLRESVYASIEIKTTLDPDDIADAVKKCRAFKGLQADWTNCGQKPVNKDVLCRVEIWRGECRRSHNVLPTLSVAGV
jgi:hypothetical protein